METAHLKSTATSAVRSIIRALQSAGNEAADHFTRGAVSDRVEKALGAGGDGHATATRSHGAAHAVRATAWALGVPWTHSEARG